MLEIPVRSLPESTQLATCTSMFSVEIQSLHDLTGTSFLCSMFPLGVSFFFLPLNQQVLFETQQIHSCRSKANLAHAGVPWVLASDQERQRPPIPSLVISASELAFLNILWPSLPTQPQKRGCVLRARASVDTKYQKYID